MARQIFSEEKKSGQIKPFIDSTAGYLYDHFKDNLGRLAIVFPNKRARLFFNSYLQTRIEKPVFTPEYYTISELLLKLSGMTLADPLTLLFNLYQVYLEITRKKEPFDEFMYYGEMMLADFDDIDKYLIDANQLFQNLHDIKDLEGYFQYLTENQIEAIQKFWTTFTPGSISPEQEDFVSLWQVLFRIYTEFNKKLDDDNIAYEGRAYKRAVERLEILDTNWNAIAFVGFNALNKCEEKLFTITKNNGLALFFWDYDDYYMKKGEFHEAAYFLHRLYKLFPNPQDFFFNSNLTNPRKKIVIIEVPGKISQTEVLHEVLQHNSDLNPTDINNLVIALADETLLSPVLHALPETIENVNISMGYPVDGTLVMSLINGLINLHINKHSGSNGEELYYYKDILQIIKNNLVRSVIDQKCINEIHSEILKNNRIFISSGFFEKYDDLLKEIFCNFRKKEDILFYFRDLLKLLAPGFANKVDTYLVIEQESLFRIFTRINRITEIIEKGNFKFDNRTILRILRKLLIGLSVPFSGEPLSGIQVMGILETRTLDFENVIILSMNEGIFPKSGYIPSMIPYNLRAGFGLPTVEHQDAIFGYYFYRLLHRANNVTLIYSDVSDGINTGEPSRFIQQLKYENEFTVIEKQIGYQVEPSLNRTISITKDNKVQQVLSQYLNSTSKYLSPSAINSYINCKLQFYFRYIAGLSEVDEVSENIEANIFGSILHEAMKLLYEPFEEKDLKPDDILKLKLNKRLLSEVVDKAFYTQYFNPQSNDETLQPVEYAGQNILLREAIIRYINKILDYDCTFEKLHLIKVEKDFFKNLQLDEDNFIRIGGRIDRIDQVSGLIRVIDYKTGKTKTTCYGIDNLFNGTATKRNSAVFQTFVYSLIVMENLKKNAVIPGLYAIREITDGSYDYHIYISKNKKREVINNFQTFSEDFENMLKQVISELFNPKISFDQTEDEKFCSWCAFNTICMRS